MRIRRAAKIDATRREDEDVRYVHMSRHLHLAALSPNLLAKDRVQLLGYVVVLVWNPFGSKLQYEVRVGLAIDVHGMKIIGLYHVHSHQNVQGIVGGKTLQRDYVSISETVIQPAHSPGRSQIEDRSPWRCGRLDPLVEAACRSWWHPVREWFDPLKTSLNLLQGDNRRDLGGSSCMCQHLKKNRFGQHYWKWFLPAPGELTAHVRELNSILIYYNRYSIYRYTIIGIIKYSYLL